MKKALLTFTLLGFASLVNAQTFNQKYFKDGMYFFNDLEKVMRNEIFTTHKNQFGLGSDDSMVLEHEQIIENGKFRASYRQYYKGIKVETGLMNIAGQQGVTLIANGSLVTNLDINTTTIIPEDSALITALDFYGANSLPWEDSAAIANYREEMDDSTAILLPPHGELIIVKLRADSLDNSAANYKMCWRFSFAFEDTIAAKDIYVDAQNNTIYTSQDAFNHWNAHYGTGWTSYDGWFNDLFTAKKTIGTMYWLKDIHRNIETKYKRELGSIFRDNNNDWVESLTKTAATAHWGVGKSFDYFYLFHGHKSMNGKGGPILIVTDVPASALKGEVAGYSYNLGIDVIGVGPDKSGASMASLDILGHEYTHGVIQNTSGFGSNPMDYEASGLNEAFCDIFGHRIESIVKGSSDWSVGENIGEAFERSISDPYNDKSDPLNTGGRSADYYLHPSLWYYGSKYSQGGVIRKWYYILANGGTIWNPSTGIPTNYATGLGANKASNIAYIGMRWWFWHNIGYQDAAQQLVNHVITDYGKCSQEHKLTARVLRSLGFTNISNVLCSENLQLFGNRVINTNQPGPIKGFFKLKQSNDNNDDSGDPRAGTYSWILPTGWDGTQSGDSLTVNSFNDYSSRKLIGKFTSTDSSIVLTDTLIVHFSDEAWTTTDTNSNSQYRIAQNNQVSQEENATITIYPNPAKHIINVRLQDTKHVASINITNLLGKNVLRKIVTNKDNPIDISNVASGNYIITVTQNQITKTEKLTITD